MGDQDAELAIAKGFDLGAWSSRMTPQARPGVQMLEEAGCHGALDRTMVRAMALTGRIVAERGQVQLGWPRLTPATGFDPILLPRAASPENSSSRRSKTSSLRRCRLCGA